MKRPAFPRPAKLLMCFLACRLLGLLETCLSSSLSDLRLIYCAGGKSGPFLACAETRKLVLTCAETSKLVLACAETGKLVLTCAETSKLVLACAETGKLVLACAETGKLVLACAETSKLVFPDFSLHGPAMRLEIVKNCPRSPTRLATVAQVRQAARPPARNPGRQKETAGTNPAVSFRRRAVQYFWFRPLRLAKKAAKSCMSWSERFATWPLMMGFLRLPLL